MSELFHECGVAAVFHRTDGPVSPLLGSDNINDAAHLIPRMLLDMQNRGQLSAGMTSYRTGRGQILDTYKEIGSVQEVFRLSHPRKAESLMNKYSGHVAIGHVRYATCGKDDRSYAQPFERHHIGKGKWFSFSFNGQLANYSQLRTDLLNNTDHYLARESDTELIVHTIGRHLSSFQPGGRQALIEMISAVSKQLDGAYSLAYVNALGEMMVVRDPMGIKPMCYASDGSLFAAASESVALANLGFGLDDIQFLKPGHVLTIVDNEIDVRPYAPVSRQAYCFFEWIYFSNVASKLDGRSVYLTRTALGNELAMLERQDGIRIDNDTIVVPVPDTSKAAADAMAHALGIPSREGLIRNRYSGRTFIEGQATREDRARIKYMPLRDVLQGKKVILVEDSIVRSTTMKVLLGKIYESGAKEIHVRVACPPIVAPCYYGIDMSTIRELFAPRFLGEQLLLTDEIQKQMARELGCDSLRYLPVEAIARAIGFDAENLCQACISGKYPTPAGQQLYQLDRNGAAAPGKRAFGNAVAAEDADELGDESFAAGPLATQ
jgi:amidophosphoribosyltransferase